MIPVHLPREELWFLLVISIINLCLCIYDSASDHAHTYKTVFDTIKNQFIEKECEVLPSEVFYREEKQNTKRSSY